MPEKELTMKQLAEELDVAESTLDRYKAKGLPIVRKGKKCLFLASAVTKWMAENRLTGQPGKPRGEVSDEKKREDLRKVKAQADNWEIRNKKEMGELLSKSEVEQGRIIRIGFVKGGLLGMPASLAPQLVGLGAEEIQTKLESEVNRLLEHFSRQ